MSFDFTAAAIQGACNERYAAIGQFSATRVPYSPFWQPAMDIAVAAINICYEQL
jgi:hypothetical protein